MLNLPNSRDSIIMYEQGFSQPVRVALAPDIRHADGAGTRLNLSSLAVTSMDPLRTSSPLARPHVVLPIFRGSSTAG